MSGAGLGMDWGAGSGGSGALVWANAVEAIRATANRIAVRFIVCRVLVFAAGNTHAGFDRHCKMNDFIRFRDQVRSEEAASETYPGGTGFASAGVTAENNSAPVPESRTLLSPVALWGCGIPHRRLRIPRGLATEHHSAQNGTTGNFYKEISMPERARASRHSFRPGFCAVVAVIAAVGLGPVVSFVLGGQVPEGTARFTPQTKVSITAERWCLNGEVTYRGTRAEGLLLNVRMVNSVFEDRHKPDYDPEANTNRFLSHLSDYAAHGVRAFTICLQGGRPRYEGALNSAFNPDGSLRESYLNRVRRVIEECDRRGLVVILGCFYQRQDQVLKDEGAVRTAVTSAAGWIRKSGFRNVVLEITNEFGHSGFDHPLLRTDVGQVELIRLAQKAAPGLLVSTAGLGDGRYPDNVAKAADFLLIHLNDTALADIPKRIAALKKFGKPIVCNEDDKLNDAAAHAAELCVTHGASWGFMANEVNQSYPFRFEGARDDPVVYAKLKELTSPVVASRFGVARLFSATGIPRRLAQAQRPGVDPYDRGDGPGQADEAALMAARLG